MSDDRCEHDWVFPRPWPTEGTECCQCGAVFAVPEQMQPLSPEQREDTRAHLTMVAAAIECDEGTMTPRTRNTIQRRIAILRGWQPIDQEDRS